MTAPQPPRRSPTALNALRAAAIVVLALMLAPLRAAAMIGSTSATIGPGDQLASLWAFEFAAGGTLSMSVSLDSWSQTNTTLQLLWMTDSQISDGISSSTTMSDLCTTLPYSYSATLQTIVLGDPASGWPQTGAVTGVNASLTFVAPTEDWYRLLQLNCAAGGYSVSVAYTAVNPGGEYLSLSDVPYKTLYVVVSIGWSVLLALWCVNWWRYRFWNIRLQRVMTLVPLTKLAFSLPELYFWRVCSSTGLQPTGLYWATFMLTAFSQAMLFAVLMTIALGWSITRANMWTEWNRLLILSACLFGTTALFAYYGGFLLFLLVLMYVMILRYIFAAIAENAAALTEQIGLIRRSMDALDVTTTPVWTKLVMFKRLQVAMVLFVSVDVIFRLWALIFLRDTPWIADCMDHLLSALMALGVGYTFRLRPFNPYFFRVASAAAIPMAAAAGAANGAAAHGSALSRSESVGPPIDAAMLLAAHSAATAAAAANNPDAAPSTPHASGAAEQPLISAGASAGTPSSSGGGSGGATGAVRPSPLQRWRPGMPLPPLPAPGSWLTDDSAASGTAGGASSAPPIIIVHNPFSDDSGTDVVLARPTYEAPPVVLFGGASAAAAPRRTGQLAAAAAAAASAESGVPMHTLARLPEPDGAAPRATSAADAAAAAVAASGAVIEQHSDEEDIAAPDSPPITIRSYVV